MEIQVECEKRSKQIDCFQRNTRNCKRNQEEGKTNVSS